MTHRPETFPEVVRRPVDTAAESNLGHHFHPLVARLYAARGISTTADADLGLANLLPPDDLPNIAMAANCLADVIEAGERILITGDYDADGATSTALLMSVLTALGADCDFLIPDRFEMGYGLSPPLARLALERAPTLVVTVDSGITCCEGIAILRAAGCQVVVTDHHLPGATLPAANAIVNPNLADSTFGSSALAGVGVAFYLAVALRQELQQRNWFDRHGVMPPNLKAALDLVALGTVADVVPLDHNNRILVAEGLKWIRRGGARPGIRALLRVGGVDPTHVSAGDIAFRVAPRLNAAGRMADMTAGVQCLLAAEGEADGLARELHEINQQRRSVEADMTSEAIRAIGDGEPDAAALCVYDSGWHQGIVGIVAGRLRERFNRPTFACAPAGEDEQGRKLVRGSGRSIEGFHLRDALTLIDAQQPGLLLAFGGHAMAAGVTLTEGRLAVFRRALERTAEALLSDDQLQAREVTDGTLTGSWLGLDTAELMEAAGPWGQQFPMPRFHGLFRVLHGSAFGATGQHVRLTLGHADGVIEAVQFNGELPTTGVDLRVVYELTVNRYRDAASPRLLLRHTEVVAPGSQERPPGSSETGPGR